MSFFQIEFETRRQRRGADEFAQALHRLFEDIHLDQGLVERADFGPGPILGGKDLFIGVEDELLALDFGLTSQADAIGIDLGIGIADQGVAAGFGR